MATKKKTAPPETEVVSPETEVSTLEIKIPTALIEIPIATDHGPMDAVGHIDIQLDKSIATGRTASDAWLFRAIGLGLSRSGATLRNGQRVGHGRSFTGDTLRWLLEQVEDVIDEAD